MLIPAEEALVDFRMNLNLKNKFPDNWKINNIPVYLENNPGRVVAAGLLGAIHYQTLK